MFYLVQLVSIDSKDSTVSIHSTVGTVGVDRSELVQLGRIQSTFITQLTSC